MNIAIIKYNAGNIQSVLFALKRIGVDAVVTDDNEEILKADKIIFPGVGEANTAMNFLQSKKLDLLIPQLKQPLLGICLGMQLLCSYSEENNTKCLGVFDTRVKRFDRTTNIKIPQIGWNTINQLKHPLFKNIPDHSHVYFVHSFYVPVNDFTIAETQYGINYSSAIAKNNFYGVQFHPEKSAEAGVKIIENFLNI